MRIEGKGAEEEQDGKEGEDGEDEMMEKRGKTMRII